MDKKQQQDGQAAQIKASLGWIKSLIQEVEFGSISGITVTDGVLAKGPKFKTTFTRKPRSHTSPGKRDANARDDALGDALRHLAQDTCTLKGEWLVKIKVANRLPITWVREQPGAAAASLTK